MDRTRESNREQAALWNGASGRAWVEEQALLDHLLQPFQDLLVAEVHAAAAHRVLDVGCGAGSTTLAVAEVLADGGRCTGIDLSAPLIDAARRRAEASGAAASFLLADAQEHAFEPDSFDIFISRFGVMFFEDPVRAFANLRRAGTSDAALRCLAFRSAAENPFMTTAERAAAPLLPNLPPRRPGAPGQFAFADSQRVERILAESGWTAIELRPLDVACSLPARELVRYVTRLGPLGTIFPQLDLPTRARVTATVRAAFEPYVDGDVVRAVAACWLMCARA
jgi:SAM-dependent methyltransferase